MYFATIQRDFFVSVADQEQQHEQQQHQYRFVPQQQQSRLNDPAIMSASFGVPLASPQDVFGHPEQAFGPPPGLAYSAGLQNNVVNDGKHYFLLFLRGRPTFERRALLGQELFDCA